MASQERAEVYFISSKPSQRVKIGWALDPRKRLKQLQTGNPESLELLGTLKYASPQKAREVESYLHRTLGSARIGSTEWFHPAPDLFSQLTDLGIFGKHIFPKVFSFIKPDKSVKNLAMRDQLVAKSMGQLLLRGCKSEPEDAITVDSFSSYTAEKFYESESTTHDFHMGCVDFNTRHVLYLVWRAGCLVCAGSIAAALIVLEQAVIELKREVFFSEDDVA